MGGYECCDCRRGTNTSDVMNILRNVETERNYSNISIDNTKFISKNSPIIKLNNFHEKEESYYFLNPEKNIFDDEELLNMKIIDVSIGIHITKIFSNNNNKGDFSFHPFFYVNLKNINNIGVIIQYIKPKLKNINSTHFFEEDGVEYLEKNNEDFEIEYLNLIKKVSKIDHLINKWLIKYDNFDLGQITLREFFNKIIPQKGKWLQKKLNPLKHGCIHFCIDAIKNLGIKKERREILLVKSRMKKVLELTENQKYYKKYVEGFNALFDAIEGN